MGPARSRAHGILVSGHTFSAAKIGYESDTTFHPEMIMKSLHSDEMSSAGKAGELRTGTPDTPSPGRERLNHVIRHCMGWSPDLQAGLASLDEGTASKLAHMIAMLRAEAVSSTSRGFIRGFISGQ